MCSSSEFCQAAKGVARGSLAKLRRRCAARCSFCCPFSKSMFRYPVASIQFSCISTASGRLSRRQLAALGKIRTNRVLRLSSSFRRSSRLVDFKCCDGAMAIHRTSAFLPCFLPPSCTTSDTASPVAQPGSQVLPCLFPSPPVVDPAQLRPAVIIGFLRQANLAIRHGQVF